MVNPRYRLPNPTDAFRKVTTLLFFVAWCPGAAGTALEAAESFAYDAVGRVAEEWQRLADGVLAGAPLEGDTARVQSTYDPLGRRVGRATPAGRALSFGHDAEGRLTAVEDGAGPLVRSSLDKLGRPKRRAMGADVGGAPAAVGLRGYTAFGELSEQRVVRDAGPGRVGLAEVFRRTYEHGATGQITAVEDSRWARGPGGPAPAVLAFAHDADGRLASSASPDRGLAAYEADPAGNVPAAPVRLPQLPAADGGLEDGASLEDALEVGRVVAVRVAAGWALGYDADGNLLSKSDTSNRHGGVSWRYAYDAAGRLAEVWRDDGAGEVRVGAYGYDVLGRRVTRRTWALDGSGLDERVVWDGDVPAERHRSIRAAASSSRTTDVEAVSVRTFAYQGFEPVAVLDGLEGAAVLECDQVGQPRLAVDRAGALVWEGRFDAWGNDLEVGPLDGSPVEGGGLEVEARFPGQVADAESGLRYNRFRYYDPGTAGYTRRDPVGLMGGNSPHNYVSDPLGWGDPYGLAKCPGFVQTAARRAAQWVHGAKKKINYDYRHFFDKKVSLETDTTFYSYKNSSYFSKGTDFEPMELWMTPDRMPASVAIDRLSLPYPSGYDTLLEVTLKEGTTIYEPRRVWKLFGRPGGGLETRSLGQIKSTMYKIIPI